MKKLIASFGLMILSFSSFSQVDTVCYQSTSPSVYTVPSLGAGYTYTWTIASPGTISSGQGTNSINVNWSNANPGQITNGVTVFATSGQGCQSQPVTLNVLIYRVIPTVTPIGPLCTGAPCVTLSGSPSGGIFSGPGVVGNQFCPFSSGTFTVTYTITSGGCTFTGTTPVVVNQNPTLSPIQY